MLWLAHGARRSDIGLGWRLAAMSSRTTELRFELEVSRSIDRRQHLDVRRQGDIGDLALQASNDAFDRCQRQVSLTALDRGIVGAVHAYGIRKRILAVSQGLTALPDGFPQLHLYGHLAHGMTVGGRHFYDYALKGSLYI